MDIEPCPNSLVVKPINFFRPNIWFLHRFLSAFLSFPDWFAESVNRLVLGLNYDWTNVILKIKKWALIEFPVAGSPVSHINQQARKTQNNKTQQPNQHNAQKHKPNSWPDPETLAACTPRSSTRWNCGALRAIGDNERSWEESWLRRTEDPSTVWRTCPWDMRCPPLGTWCES